MAKKWKDMSLIEKAFNADIINVASGGSAADKYNEWLEKSDKKVNPHSFAGRFLKVSFWVSTLISAICFFALLTQLFDSMSGEMTEAGKVERMFFLALFIPFFFTAAIKILRSRYYGLYKLLWLFPLVMWALILAVFGLGILSDVNPELYNKLWSLFGA